MPRKVPFNVIYASSEDERFRGSELDEHGPTVKGWQSEKFCQYPQEIIFRLEYPISLVQVQILAHQYLIPRKMELWLGPETGSGGELSQLGFDYIGYITLSDNEKSGYKSRELKSISVPSSKGTAYVRLSLDRPHENSLNKFSQVSLVAVQLLGEARKDVSPASPWDDLSFEMYVDREVATIIRQMERNKEDAVKHERFRYAGKLKAAMNGLREVGERLGRYEVGKQQAIANEDYARASRKKQQMDALRTEAYQTFNVEQLLEEKGANPKNDSTGDDLSEDRTPSEDLPDLVGAMEAPAPGLYQSPLSPLRYTSPPAAELIYMAGTRSGSSRRHKQTSPYEEYDERLIAPAQRPSGTEDKALSGHPVLKMNEREKKQAALPISVFGSQLVEKFYSRHYSDKEDGVRSLESLLKNGRVEGNKVARAAVFLLHRALRDKVFSVYSLAAAVVEFFFNSFVSNRVSTAEISRSVEKLLPELLAKSGDVTPRIHNTAVHTILAMAHAPELRKVNLIPVHITRPLTSALHPRLALSRLEITEQLILSLGISSDKTSDTVILLSAFSGMTARTLAEFGASGLHHPAEAVRKVAERVLVLVYRVNPRMVRKQLPPDDDITRRNLLYRQLMKEFDKIDNEVVGDPREVSTREGSQSRGANRKLTRSESVSNTTSTSQPEQLGDDGAGKLKKSGSCYTANRVAESPQEKEKEKQCIFCLQVSQGFTEEGLNIHYWKSCPMLTRCATCGEVVEIASLGSHIATGCAQPGQPHSSAESRCPFCKLLIENTEAGWRSHLVQGNICPNHPRAGYISKGELCAPTQTA